MSRRLYDLGGDNWKLGRAASGAAPERATWEELGQVQDWLPAQVPGNVRGDLVRAGRLPDLVFGQNVEAAQWVDDHCWWLVRDFSVNPATGERVHLVLRGVDYISDLFLNGRHLGRHEGMFSPQVHDVTDLIQDTNRLAVRLLGSEWLPSDRSSAWEKLLNRIEARFGGMPARFPHRRDTLKCQMSFGWDFAPPLRTMGIWDDAYLVLSGDVFVEDVVARQQLLGDEILLTVDVQLHARTGGAFGLRCTLSPETFEGSALATDRSVVLSPGSSSQRLELVVGHPRLWWPWDQGDPDLYHLCVEVLQGDQVSDAVDQSVGLRHVELRDWTLHVNGGPVYARGANWVPADILPGQVTGADYRDLLHRAREANMNMLRVWGGGLREKRAFYDLCDRLGMLVWQEFPLACAFLTRYPRSPGYLSLAAAEAQAIVRELRNHPSVVLWCGGNEFSPRRNRPVVAALRQAVQDLDPTRPFLPVSPAEGDSHNWRVWHQCRPAAVYRDDQALFASEFGLQAPPDAETLRRFIPREELWPAGPSWAAHGAGLEKLRRYARPFLEGLDIDLEGFVYAAQHAQSHGLQIGVEHYRRRKAQGCGGLLVWQLNEPWPAISWALIDFFRQPKPAFELVGRLFNPILVSVAYELKQYRAGDRLAAEVWLISDRAEGLAGCDLEVVLWAGADRAVDRFQRSVDVSVHSAEIVGRLDSVLPPGGSWRLTCTLSRDGHLLSSNEYDLAACDDIQPTLRQRVWAWFTSLVVPS